MQPAPGALPFIREIRLERHTIDSFDVYPYSLPVVRSLRTLRLHPRVTFLVGENGSGKSTLIEAVAIAWGFNAEGGSQNFHFATRVSHSALHEHLTLVKTGRRPTDGFFLRAESYFNVATEIERLDEGGGGPKVIGSYGGRSLHEQSHGESFLALAEHRFRAGGLYILDEPEAALSPAGIVRLIAVIHKLTEQGAQFIVATHSPLLLACPDALVYELGPAGLKATPFDLTAHFQLTKRYLMDPQRLAHEATHDLLD